MSIGKLLDWSQARPNLAQIKAHGYSAAYRYVCSDAAERGLAGKRLTPTERDQILHAGLDIGLHGEDEAGAARKGYARGLAQGRQWADYAHTVLDAPKGMTIVAAIDYDTGGVFPQVVHDYLGGVRDGLQNEYAAGVYGSIYVVDAALAAKVAVHGVQTNAWSHGKVSPWAHVYQHGPSEFPGTDYNDVLRVPHGTWLQTIGGDDMALDPNDPIVKQILEALTLDQAHPGDPSLGAVYKQLVDYKNDSGHTNTVPGIKKTVSDTSAAVLTAVATLAAKVTDLADAVAQLQGGATGGPVSGTVSGSLTITPS